MRIRVLAVATALMALALGSRPAHATFHLMQIEQVIGGVSGDTTAQAIQLRMRAAGQGGVSQGRLVAYDHAGKNPVVLIDFFTDIFPEQAGSRILITSAGFASHTMPEAVADFTLTNLIPSSYLAAGSLTFERDSGSVLWRLSWGGSAYTGSNRGKRTNDRNGRFGPPFGGPLPSKGTEAVEFQGAASDKSTNNADDYDLTTGPAVFTNHAGQSFVVEP